MGARSALGLALHSTYVLLTFKNSNTGSWVASSRLAFLQLPSKRPGVHSGILSSARSLQRWAPARENDMGKYICTNHVRHAGGADHTASCEHLHPEGFRLSGHGHPSDTDATNPLDLALQMPWWRPNPTTRHEHYMSHGRWSHVAVQALLYLFGKP